MGQPKFGEKNVQNRISNVLVLSFIGLVAGGCSRPTVAKPDATYDRLSWIGDAYMRATDKFGRGPANFDEIKPYLTERGDPSEIRRSDNDKEEFIFHWNVDYRTYEREGKQFPVTAYEAKGRGKLRYVLQVRIVSELTAEQLKQAPFPPGATPPAN